MTRDTAAIVQVVATTARHPGVSGGLGRGDRAQRGHHEVQPGQATRSSVRPSR
ncbi:hypothetical protein [Spongiactinospora sp. TRM90649]|uniref:hypothetical protein n=1 Tax=Spongiactinospora sp. TRM90649 TaxID=3031114 RepID=UPI0023F6F16B|nr:hypothetical protein [Spongiactinospora sp. TRM90649]MDF5754417.1 hypothetical protein [Spongiactinospora sp. TRM90649]